METTLARESKFSARLTLIVLAVLALAGMGLGLGKGKLPHASPAVAGEGALHAPYVAEGALHAPYVEPTGIDLQLYDQVVREVRAGRDYYEVAREKLPQFGFPISSPFNWRLPTYAWLFARLPNAYWIQGVLLALAVIGLGLAFTAERRRSGMAFAVVTALLLFGVVRWTIDGQAYLAQEVWAAVLMLISVSAHALARGPRKRGRESLANSTAETMDRLSSQKTPDPILVALSIAAGTAALLFRELALPYCVLAYVVAIWHRRWLEALGWATGMAAFGLLLGWHVGQVQAQLAGIDQQAGAGLSQWLRFGGLDFVLLTTRMNSLLFAAPAALLWCYLLAALVGLSRRTDATGRLCCLASLAYLLAFAVAGRPENFYWGLMAAPLLPWGVAAAPRVVADLWERAGFVRSISSASAALSG
jgi:hypothetical protein